MVRGRDENLNGALPPAIRRRDNLAIAIYMVAETLFWFYPLVRWIGNRLMDERERAWNVDRIKGGDGRRNGINPDNRPAQSYR